MKILGEYDHIDSMEDLYAERIQAEIENRGPKFWLRSSGF